MAAAAASAHGAAAAQSIVKRQWDETVADPVDLTFHDATSIADFFAELDAEEAAAAPNASANSTSSSSAPGNGAAAAIAATNASIATTSDATANAVSPSASFSMRKVSISQQSTPTRTGPGGAASTDPSAPKSSVATSTVVRVALKLGNNQLAKLDVTQFPALLRCVGIDPSRLKWLDLSFNRLTVIDEAIALCPNITHLYLHANAIDNLRAVERALTKLPCAQHLATLTMHGNPAAADKDYKTAILRACPRLRHLDFGGVSRGDRSTARYTAGNGGKGAGVPRAAALGAGEGKRG
ncbi:Leucine-rich repeat-containing protein 51 [Allomyces arbusculus]|nr:Leucine-rich repeat-containing protein 51 [Allomyces arbusculus]